MVSAEPLPEKGRNRRNNFRRIVVRPLQSRYLRRDFIRYRSMAASIAS
jgi:hypothetical protein